MASLSQSQKKHIAYLKEQLSRLLLKANRLNYLADMENILLQEILCRQMKDRIGDYEGRVKEIYQDYYIVSGIIYRHTKGNLIESNSQIAYLEPNQSP